jgi:tripartite ATP-independent transporter DctP family solute receptor
MFTVLAAAILSLVFSFSSGKLLAANAGQPYVIRIADSQPETSTVVQHIRMFGNLLSEKTNGRITIQIFGSGMMGPAPTVMQQVQMGAIDIYRCDASVIYDFGIDSMKVLSLPYLFDSKEAAQKVLYGEVGDKFLKDVEDGKIGFKPIGWIIEPARNLFLRNRKVTSIGDMKGLKIRTPESEIFLATMEAFGAAATPLSMGEVYTSIQTGVVDGAENTVDTFNINKFNEVCKYITLDAHNFNICPVVFSTKNWEKLSADDQKLILDCWAEASHAYDSVAIEGDIKAQEIAKANGVEILTLTDKEKWLEAVKPLYDKYGAGYEKVIADIQGK